MVLPYIDMTPPWVYMCSPSWTPPHLPPHPIPLGHPNAPAPSTLYYASNLDWWSVSYMIIYMFQCHSPKPSHPGPRSPTESKRLFYTSVSLLLSRIQGYHYHLSKFHIYALVYCFSFSIPLSIPWEHSKEAYSPYIAYITQGTGMRRILYSEQSWQNIHCTLSSVSYIVFSQMFTATEDKEKNCLHLFWEGFQLKWCLKSSLWLLILLSV